MARRVVVVGSGSELACRLVDALRGAPGIDEVRHVTPAGDLDELVAGADTVVDLGRPAVEVGGVDGTGLVPDVAVTRGLVAAAARHGVAHVVLLSSALVYGAWPNNPVPLTEDATVRPLPGFSFAVARAETERSARAGLPPGVLTVLRPTLVLGPGLDRWFARSPWRADVVRAAGGEPPRQFLHVDDLVSALALAVARPLAGTFNVAPEGWIPPDTYRDLRRPAPRLHVPPSLVEPVVRLRPGATPVPVEVLPHVRHPWVVAADRLRAEGWEAGHRNEEVLVEVDRPLPTDALGPRQRQLLSIGAVVGAVVGVVAGVVVWARRRSLRAARPARRG